jgi:hypothetical protein
VAGKANRICRSTDLYLLVKQHMIPDLPKNQIHPMNRITERKIVAMIRAWKKWAVLTEALFYNNVSRILM